MANKKKPNTDFFSNLKRMFSPQTVLVKTKSGKLKSIDTALQQGEGALTNSLTRHLASRYLSSSRHGYSSVNNNLGKGNRYNEYDKMDKSDAIISSALDIYADETTTPNEYGYVFSISTENEKIKEELENLYFSVMNVDVNLWSWVRGMCKYGDYYLFLEIVQDVGITNVIPISADAVDRIEKLVLDQDENGKSIPRMVSKFEVVAEDPVFQFRNSEGKRQFDNYEIAHFRSLGDTSFLPYGKSMIEGARVAWQQLSLMEDAMLLHRIVRAPDRRVFTIEVGNASADVVQEILTQVKQNTKRVPHVDENNGNYNLRYNLSNLLEDIYVPSRNGTDATRVDTLPGLSYQVIDDIEYLKNKMISATKIPKAFLGFEESLGSKSTLAAEDVRFARTISRIQRFVVGEITKIGMVHLVAKGYEFQDAGDFEIIMNSPSIIFEKEQLDLLREKIGVAEDAMRSGLISREWIYDVLFDMSDEEMTKMKDSVLQDSLFKWKVYNIENNGEVPSEEMDQEESGDVEFSAMANSVDFGNDGSLGGGKSSEEIKADSKIATSFKGGSPLSQESFLQLKKKLQETIY